MLSVSFQNEVVYPAIAIAQHLRNIGFRKKAFVLGVERFRDEIRNLGVDVLPYRGVGFLYEGMNDAIFQIR